MLWRRFSFVISVSAPVLFFPVLALACAVCVTGAADDPVTDAFKWSVLFLMATPYTIVGSIAGWLVYTHWRAAAKKSGGLKKKTPFLRLAWIYKESGR